MPVAPAVLFQQEVGKERAASYRMKSFAVN